MQIFYLPSSFTKCNENCGLPDFLTDYQIRHLGNPSGLPEMLPKIDPCILYFACVNGPKGWYQEKDGSFLFLLMYNKCCIEKNTGSWREKFEKSWQLKC